MYSHQLRARALGAGEDDAPVAIPGFTPAMAQAQGGGFDWNDLINTVLNDVTQIIKPNTPSTHPIYTPTSTAIGSALSSPAVLILGGVALYLILKKR